MKLFTDELALELTKKLLQNDKDIRDDLQAKINAVSNGTGGGTSPIITLTRTPDDDGIIITVTDLSGTNSVTVYDGLHGKNAQVAKIEPIVGGNRITFTYFNDDNIQQTSELEVMNGKDGTSVAHARIENGNELYLELSDGSEINAGAISIDSSNLSLENFYTKAEVDALISNQKVELETYIDEKVDETVDIKVDETVEEKVDVASTDEINGLF